MSTAHSDPDQPAWRNPARSPDERARALVAELTLAEKVAQLGSWWEGAPAGSDDIAGGGDPGGTGGAVAPTPAAFTAAADGHPDGFPDGLGQLTRVFGTQPVSVAEGVARVRTRQAEIVRSGRLGIPALVHEECLTGFTTLGATAYPAPPAWAATFDPDLFAEMAAAIGADLRAVGVHQGLAPVLDVVRDRRWGRVEETLGEDPYVVATIGSAYVRGLQRAGLVATLKHFAGYAASRGARNHAPVSMGPREYADVVLPPFQTAIREGGARSVMNSYTDVDGVPCAANERLLTGILRGSWGFTGTVVSDYWAVTFLQTMHHLAADPAAAGALALAAGMDVELPGTACFGAALVDQVRAGRVAEHLVDRAVLRVLRQKAELGLLDPDWTPIPGTDRTGGAGGDGASGTDVDLDLDSPRNRDLARRVAEQSVVLLANTGVLPCDPATTERVAVLGPCAEDPATFLGCYSFANHVLPRYPHLGTGVRVDTLLSALRAELPTATVEHVAGCPVRDPDRSGFDAAVRAARDAQLCVLAVGDRPGMFGGGTSGEGCDAADLSLPGVQAELVERVLDAGTPVVLVVVSGRPYALGAFAGRAAAMVQAFLPGEEGGAAIAGVLSGRVSPSGRLPLQIPRDPGDSVGDHRQPPLGRASDGISNLDPTPLFPVGHGLGYTTFSYRDLRVGDADCATDGAVEVAATVANDGDREAAEVVQLYLHHPSTQVTRPVRELVGYRRVVVAPGSAVRVTFTVHADRTSFTGVDLRRVVEPGPVRVFVGRSAEDLPLAGAYTLTGPLRAVGADRVLITPVAVERLP